ncbi:MAG: hypothetical protein WCK73_07185 [Deltaproteobacteria bacterium]
MTHSDERVASEMGRALMAIYRAGLRVQLWPDPLRGKAGARIASGAGARARRRRASAPRSASGRGDSPLAAIYDAVHRLNERTGAVVVRLE